MCSKSENRHQMVVCAYKIQRSCLEIICVKYRGLDTGCMSACNQYPTLRTSHRLFQGNFSGSWMHKQPFNACFQTYCTYLVTYEWQVSPVLLSRTGSLTILEVRGQGLKVQGQGLKFQRLKSTWNVEAYVIKHINFANTNSTLVLHSLSINCQWNMYYIYTGWGFMLRFTSIGAIDARMW